jgi:hypothetical protein
MTDNKYNMQTYADLVSDLWDSECIFLVEFLQRCAIVKSERYMQTLTKLKQRSRRIRWNRRINAALITLQSRFSTIRLPNLVSPKDAFLWRRLRTTTSWNKGCMRSSDASAKSFKRPICSVSLQIGKYKLIMKETLWKINLTFKWCTHDICKFLYNYSNSFWEKRRHFLHTASTCNTKPATKKLKVYLTA